LLVNFTETSREIKELRKPTCEDNRPWSFALRTVYKKFPTQIIGGVAAAVDDAEGGLVFPVKTVSVGEIPPHRLRAWQSLGIKCCRGRYLLRGEVIPLSWCGKVEIFA
ncbi:putative trans-sialidase, partial [Trypanosoma cruzi]